MLCARIHGLKTYQFHFDAPNRQQRLGIWRRKH
jgi:hypothetical protein